MNQWKPNKWIAAILAFFLQPLGMLYVMKPKWAGMYLLLALIIPLTEVFLISQELLPWSGFVLSNYLLMIVCAVHAFNIAKNSELVTDRPWFSKWYGILSFPVVFFVLVYSFRAFVFEPFRFPSGSMLPTINSGEILIVKKWGYGNYGTYGINLFHTSVSQKLERGDILVFEYPKDRNVVYAKRLIGLPGDTVEYKNKVVYLNDIKLETQLISEDDESIRLSETLDGVEHHILLTKNRRAVNTKVIVPENSYFVSGDNRDNSNDSRYWGFVPQDAIVGKVVYIFGH